MHNLQLVLLVNDGMAILNFVEHNAKYSLVAFVRWYRKTTNEQAILNDNGK